MSMLQLEELVAVELVTALDSLPDLSSLVTGEDDVEFIAALQPVNNNVESDYADESDADQRNILKSACTLSYLTSDRPSVGGDGRGIYVAWAVGTSDTDIDIPGEYSGSTDNAVVQVLAQCRNPKALSVLRHRLDQWKLLSDDNDFIEDVRVVADTVDIVDEEYFVRNITIAFTILSGV